MHFSKLPNIIDLIAKCTCPNYRMYLSQLKNDELQVHNILRFLPVLDPDHHHLLHLPQNSPFPKSKHLYFPEGKDAN